MLRFHFISILLILNCFIFAQGSGDLLADKYSKNLIINNYSVNEGLSSNSIRKVQRIKNGYLIIATYNGISAFDGKYFTNFNATNVPSVKSSNIYDFYVDSLSNYWFGTHNGVVVYNGKDFYIPAGMEASESLSVQRIEMDKKGVLWIGTTSNGLYTFQHKKLEKVTQIPGIDKSIISMIFTDNKGCVWIANELGNLFKFDGKEYVKIQNTAETNGVFSACQDKNGEYYFGTRKGLYTIKNNKLTLISDKVSLINDLCVDKEGRLWIASNSGLFYFLKEQNKFVSLAHNNGLFNQIVQTIYFDDENIIWVGTYRKGLIQCRLGLFENFSFSDIGVDEIPSDAVQYKDSIYLISTDEGEIYEFKNKTLQKFNINTSIKNSRIKNLFIDSKKNIWVCSYKGLYKISNKYGQSKSELIELPDKTIRKIIETDDGFYWVGTRQSGLYKLSENQKIFKTINSANHLSSNFIMSLVKGRNGKIFVATKSGFDILLKDSIVGHYDVHSGLSDNLVFNIYEDSDGVIWIATIKGLSRLENGKITIINSQNGLIDNQIFDVTEDSYGYLWLPTNNGIVRVKKSELNAYSKNKNQSINLELFDQNDGMHNSQYVSSSKLLKMSDGKILINTNSGLSILDPMLANSVHQQPSLTFSSISTESFSKIVDKNYYQFAATTKYVQIDFAYIDFYTPEKVDFNYILEPFDNKWQPGKNYRFAKYTNLPPGDYTFRVQAKVQSRSGLLLEKSIRFTIKPAFYETLWFKIFVVIILTIVIWLVYILRIKNIKYQKELLENVVEERTKEINVQKDAIEQHINELEIQKAEIAEKNEEILITGNKIEQAYLNLKLLSDLGQEVTSYLNEEDIVRTVYHDIVSLMDSDLVSIGNFIEDENIIRFNSTIYKGKKMSPAFISLKENNCILSYSFNHNVEIITNNIQIDYPEFSSSFPDLNTFKTITSAIVLPIRTKSGISGVFTVQSFRKNSYSDYHFNLLKNLVIYVGIAIENSKTYKKIKEQKDELIKVNSAKDRMFSIIGHDLRGPVGTIKSFLDLIIENPELANSENTLEILKTMQQSLGSAYNLLDNLLLWARSQRGQLDFEPRVFYIKQPVDEIVSLIIENAKNKNITVESQINYNELVYADLNMITTVLRNLVSNAIKFTPRGGKILVVTDKSEKIVNGNIEEKVEIKVIDNGIGISKADIEKILQVNEIFSTQGTEKETGSGLGIGICIEFLNRHKQKLYIDNNQDLKTNFEKGTTFKFYLNRNSES